MECINPELLVGVEEVTLIFSFGMDGTDHPEFGQKILNPTGHPPTTNSYSSKAFALVTNMTPVRVVSSTGKVLWRCPAPMSPRYCRVCRIGFEKEDTNTIHNEYERLNQELSEIAPVDFRG